jgi:signal transduction histidine kinase
MKPSSLSKRMQLLQWAMPLAIALMAAIFQLGPARIVHDWYGHEVHWGFEVLFYSTTGPIVVWYGLRLIRKWLGEKEGAESEVYRLNAELQERVDERTRELSEKNEALAKANADLQQLDTMKSEFVSLVSHELRAPLTNMRSALELIEGEENPLDANNSPILAIMDEQVSRLTRMVDEVLNVSRIEAGGLKVTRAKVDVLQVADHVVEEFTARQTGHKLRMPQGRQHPRVWADPDYLHEVITNLVDNAMKYSPAGSDVTMAVEVQDGEGITSVTDQGPGIFPKDRERIFEKFHRLDMGDSKETYGYGLGLYI